MSRVLGISAWFYSKKELLFDKIDEMFDKDNKGEEFEKVGVVLQSGVTIIYVCMCLCVRACVCVYMH